MRHFKCKFSNHAPCMIIAAIVFTTMLSGCASSGPIATGKDSYMITKQSAGGVMVPGAQVKAEIIGEANEFCAKTGRTMELVTSDAKNAIPFARMSSAEIHFKCIVSS